MDRICIYCEPPWDSFSEDHVLSASLGCKEVIKDSCKSCNSTLGHSIEAPLTNGLQFFRSMLRIPGRDGVIPDFKCEGEIDGLPVNVTLASDGRVVIPPQPLKKNESAREYRLFNKDQETRVEQNLKERHTDLHWQRFKGDQTRANVDIRAEFDSSVLCTPEASRAVAKYCFNLMTFHFGTHFTAHRFQCLRRFIATGEYAGHRPAGVIWNESLIEATQAPPPNHLLSLFADGRKHRVVGFLFLFALFPFCVVAEDSTVNIDLFQSFSLDPYEGRFSRVLVGSQFTEARLAKLIADEPRGTIKQAAPAGRYAYDWVLKTCKERRGPDGNFVCYECGQQFGRLGETCPHCGKPPSPPVLAKASFPSVAGQ